MVTPTLSIVIPSIRESVIRTLGSLSDQVSHLDEIIIVQEKTGFPEIAIQKWINGCRVNLYVDTTLGNPAFGYKARKFGLSKCRGDFVHVIGDDDIYLPNSIAKLRELMDQERTPIMCKMKRAARTCGVPDTIWRTQDLTAGDNIAGEMFVFPNEPEKFGSFGEHYTADNDFMRQTIVNFGGVIRWSEIELCLWRANPS